MDRNLSVHEQHELRVLELVEERDKITQRGVATELEIAVGMANALIKRLVHKGYIKVKDAPSRRFGYYITPEGFMEKGRLVSKYIANSFKFFGEARRDYEAIARQISEGQIAGVCCVGTGEVREIAQMVFAAHNIEVFPVREPFPNFQKRRKPIYDFTICRQRMYTFLCINVRYVSSYQFRMYRFFIYVVKVNKIFVLRIT